MKYLEKFDLIGRRPYLYMKDRHKFNSCFGGLLSFFILILLIGALIFLGIDIIDQTNPLVNSAIQSFDSPDELVLDKTNWEFFFGLQYNNTLYIDESIYQIKAKMLTFQNTDFISRDIHIEPCNNSSFTDSNSKLFSLYNFKGSWCISKNQTDTIMLNKVWGQENFSYIELSLWPCKNTTLSKICASEEIINQYLKIGVFSIYTSYYNIKTINHTNPFTTVIYNDFFPVSKNTLTHAFIFLMHSEMNTDEGMIFQNMKTLSKFSIDRAKYNYYSDSESDNRFLKFQFELSNLKRITTRRYIKLQEVLAQIGGIMKFLMIIGSFINFLVSNILIKEYLVNLFYDLETEKPNLTVASTINLKDISDNIQINSCFPSKLYYPLRNKIKLSKCEYILFCCFKSKNIKLLNYSYNQLKRYLSVENIILLTRKLSTLKYFILSSYESDLINSIGNPIIDIDEKTKGLNNNYDKMIEYIKEESDYKNSNISYNKSSLKLINSSQMLNNLIDTYNNRPSYCIGNKEFINKIATPYISFNNNEVMLSCCNINKEKMSNE